MEELFDNSQSTLYIKVKDLENSQNTSATKPIFRLALPTQLMRFFILANPSSSL
jgi:hypothetical protein